MLMRTFSNSIKTLIFFLICTLICHAASNDPERGRNGMVVSASDLASVIGTKIMDDGGNAIDAAVAVGFTLAVTYPSAGNIGGGGFMVIHFPDGENTTIDFREKAPSSATANMYLDSNGVFDIKKSTRGWSSSGVPGSVAGLLYALEKYGSKPLEEVIQPAIDLAENGFPLSYRLAQSINYYNDRFLEIESSEKIFTNKGNPLVEGELFVQKDLANTLKLIRDNGRDGFYKGYVAWLIAEQSKKNGGYISLSDLEEYQPVERVPVIGKYKEYDIVSMAPPSSGGIAIIQALNILENFDLKSLGWGSSDYYHLLTETLKYVYADRAKHLGDPDFVSVPSDWLLSKDYSRVTASRIDSIAVRSEEIYPGIPPAKESEETTHYSIADSYGNAVSVTTTINSSYGNKVVVEGAGFLMNNEMDDFSAKPGVPNQFGLIGSKANEIQPRKRMLSSMTPTIILKDNTPFMVIGSPGGSTIITTVLQVILNVLDFGMDIQHAIDMPRIHHQWKPDQIDYEEFGLSDDVKRNLKNKKHKLGRIRVLGRAEGIIIDKRNGIIWGASDPRGYGKAVGY